MTDKLGIFSAHAGSNLRFFDKVSEAQDWAEQHENATLRKDYGAGWQDVASWDGSKWSYIHRKPKAQRKAR
jgi:hypothetical protein